MKKNNLPLVSIIIAMYKGEKYIRECIESVINQDYSELEIILIDDGSPDKCGEIADKYAQKDKRIIVVHQKNMGVSASRTKELIYRMVSIFALLIRMMLFQQTI